MMYFSFCGKNSDWVTLAGCIIYKCGMKNTPFWPTSRYISETIQDKDIVSNCNKESNVIYQIASLPMTLNDFYRATQLC